MKANDPEKSTCEAVTALALGTLAIVRKQEEAIVGEDAWEALHDYRVALRQLRSLLGSIKGIYPAESLEAWRATLSAVASETGAMRDLDVHLLSRHKIEARLPEDLRKGCTPVFSALQRQRRQAHRRLGAFLRSTAYQSGMEALEQGLSTAAETPQEGEVGSSPIRQQAAAQIHRRLRQLDRRTRKLIDDAPDEEIHRIRIIGKKLRYLLDFFSDLFPEKAVSQMERQLAGLQRKLGDFNDACVQQETLARYAQKPPSSLSPHQLQALGGLRAALYGVYLRKRRAARKALSTFAKSSTTQRLSRQLQKSQEAPATSLSDESTPTDRN